MPCASTCRNRRPGAPLLGVALATALIVVSASAAIVAQQGTYHSGTQLVVLQVTVVDQQQRYVPTLRQEDFRVLEEGVPQAVTLFASAAAPLDVTLLIDTSSSMTERMAMTQRAASSFIRSLRADARASVVLFSNRVQVAQPLTADRALLEAAIRRAHAGGGTALHEALYISLRELERLRRGSDELRRQALVVLSDGDDTASRLSFDDVLEQARRGGVTIFTIYPSAPLDLMVDPTLLRQQPASPYEMRQLADETGGRAFAPSRVDDLSAAYGQIGEELGYQYWLAYAPSARASGFRRVSVRIVEQPTLRARTRSGYYAQRAAEHATLRGADGNRP